MVTEQLNNMRTIELQLEQNRLQHKRNLVELDYQIKRLTRRVTRLSDLDTAGVVIKSQLEDAGDELEYFEQRRTVTLESQSTDARMQETQLKFLQKSGSQLEESLVLARKNLDALNVRAPVSGKLSGLDVEVGQSIQRGGRLGQIDDPDSFKLRADIDEYYLGRVDIEQSANFEKNGIRFDLIISKIYPQVNNGQFAVDLTFVGDEPNAIRRGQTIQAKLTLGDSTESLLIPNGAFYQDTGGHWMFVVTRDRTQAVRRNVRLGRRNSRYIEVLDGLAVGEEVVTSPYSSFKQMDRLKLTQ
jgi:HlyD family secretion protein